MRSDWIEMDCSRCTLGSLYSSGEKYELIACVRRRFDSLPVVAYFHYYSTGIGWGSRTVYIPETQTSPDNARHYDNLPNTSSTSETERYTYSAHALDELETGEQR